MDRFSSYYSGVATFTPFRRDDILYYKTPELWGISLAAASTPNNSSLSNRRNQLTISYKNKALSLGAGFDSIGGDTNQKMFGLSASYIYGPLYFAAKVEEFRSDISGSAPAANGNRAVNGLVEYTYAKHTLRAMLASVDGYGEVVIHGGWDYKYKKNLKFFVEYYQEQETAAIAGKGKTTASGEDCDPADSGGRVLMVGLRFDISKNWKKLFGLR